MSLLSQRNSNHSDVLFTARVDNVKNISQILKAINFKDVSLVLLFQMFHLVTYLPAFNKLLLFSASYFLLHGKWIKGYS